MSEGEKQELTVIQQQIKELDAIFAKAIKDLNIASAKEQIAKWKAKSVPLVTQHVGPQYGQKLSATVPGPSFTNDLVEELSDEVDVYRTCLEEMAKELT